MPAVHLLISGRVQGVWYRASTQETAQALGLVGWVRNLPDGRVEALAEGPRASLERLVAWCQEGPPAARVSDVQADFRDATDAFTRFEVRYR